MLFLLTLAFPAVAISQTSPLGSLHRSAPLLVRAVIDGNTIDVATIGRVRLLGIVAPRVGRGPEASAPFGREARDRLAGLVLNRWITLEHETGDAAVRTRRSAYVITGDGQFINAVLVRDGLARVSPRRMLTRLAELQKAESDARTARRGMWGGAPEIPLASYTRPSGATRAPASKRKKHKRKTQP